VQVRLERVTEANSADLQAYAAERVALEEGALDRLISPFTGHRQIRWQVYL
jgi:hypothetical protein